MNESKKISKDEKLKSLLSEIKMSKKKKIRNVSARLSEADYIMLRAKAELADTSMNDFIVEAIKSKKVTGYDEIKIKVEDILNNEDGLEA